MRPTQRCVFLFLIGIPVALLTAVVSAKLWAVWLVWFGLSLLACVADAIFAVSPRRMEVALTVPDTIYIGDSGEATVSLSAGRSRPTCEVLADLHRDLAPQPVGRVRLAGDGRTRYAIPLVPRRRGSVGIRALWVRWTGPFGLVRRQWRGKPGSRIAVVPNVGAVRRAALRFFSSREFLSGLKVEHYVGEGSEFESLREYVPGLDHRAMNWKASARHRQLLCTEYRAERNHQVVLALDTGHLMAEPLEGIPKVDHAINAALLLSYVCLRTGDRVGWYTFDERARTFSEPEGGTVAFRRIQRRSADIVYSNHETNFTLGLAELSTRLRRRTLVVLLTDFVDTVTAELMIDGLARLSRRHLLLFVTLRDPSLDALIARHPDELDDVYRAVVADDFVRERDVVLRRLQRLGVHCIDTRPDLVTTSLLNRYLDLKRREAL
jgi:uncharacterized protein (DUF58 family)